MEKMMSEEEFYRMTKTQEAIALYRLAKRNHKGLCVKKLSSDTGTSLPHIVAVDKMAREGRFEELEILYDGGKVNGKTSAVSICEMKFEKPKSEFVEKRLEKKMTHSEAKLYEKTHKKWRMVKEIDIPFSCLLDEEWTLVDKVVKYKEGDERFHPMFPDQKYPTICRVVKDKLQMTEGSPHILYRALFRK